MNALLSRPVFRAVLAIVVLTVPAELSAQASTGDAAVDERIDDLASGLRADRPKPAATGPSLNHGWRLDSYDPAMAQARTRRQDRWKFTLTPFAWVPAMHGDLTVRGRTADVDMSIGDVVDGVIDNFNFAGMLRFEASRCNWSIIGGLIYIDLGNEETVGPAAFPIDVEWKSTTLIAEAFLGYRFATLPLGCGNRCFKPTVGFDALAGARLYTLSAEIDLDPGPDDDGNQTWVDPVVGVRALFDVTPSLTFNVMANVGGFGVGSDLSWEVIGGVIWDLGPCFSLVAGWAVLDIDYESGSFGYNVNMSGPYLGALFRF